MPEISSRSHWFEQKKGDKYIQHGAEDLSGASLSEILPFLVGSAQLCLTPSTFENLTFFMRSWQTKNSNPTWLHSLYLETRVSTPASAPTHPDASLSFFFRDRRIDRCFLLSPNSLMLKEGDLHAPCNIQGTQACGKAITWTAGGCFAVIFAMRGPSIRMFGHLFVDAEPASDWALVERMSWTRNITCTHRDALAWLFQWKQRG